MDNFYDYDEMMAEMEEEISVEEEGDDSDPEEAALVQVTHQ